MRPLVLTMQAFGPYANKETIDFTKLGNRTMFVISGKTGSGKTTIFDGISFAIYGKASGEDRNGQDLRSQFAADDVETEVTLDFYLKGKRYFICRTPKQLKKKVHGDGYREVNATANLYVYNEEGEQELIAAGVVDTDQKIKELMQIDSNQFRQILMIPQGEFRRLLTSDSKEKEGILQKLFHTEVYKRVEEKLKEQSTELEAAIKNEINERSKAIGRIQVEFNEELKSYLEAGSVNDVLIIPLLVEEISLITGKLETLSNELKNKEKEKEALQQKVYEGENLVKQFQTFEQLKERKQFLAGKQQEIKAKEQEIVLARKASHLAKQDELCHRLNRELQSINQQLEERKQQNTYLSDLFKKKEAAYETEKNREEERKSAQEEVHYLQSIQADVKQLSALQQEVQSIEEQLKLTKEKQQITEDEFNNIKKNLELLHEQKTKLEKTEVSLLQNERALEQLDGQLHLYAKLTDSQQRFNEAAHLYEERKGKFSQVENRLHDAKNMLDELQNQWMKGQAAVLARELQDGEECPVCGSNHHPKKASDHHDALPTQEDIKAAKEQVAYYEKLKSEDESKLLQIQSQILSFKTSVEEVISEIKGKQSDFTLENFDSMKNSLLTEKDKLIKEKERLIEQQGEFAKIKLQIEKLEADSEKTDATVKQLTTQLNELTVQYTAKNTTLSNMVNRIPAEIQNYEKFTEKLAVAEKRVLLLKEQFEKAQKEWQETREQLAQVQSSLITLEAQQKAKNDELDTERKIFITKLHEEGFANYRVFDEAKRQDGQITFLEKEVQDYYAEVRSINDQYELLNESLKDKVMPNLAELQNAVQAVRDEIEKLNNDYTSLLVKKRDNEEILKTIETINKQLKALEEKYKLIGELSDIARGKNALRITFERYVLASFLDEILYEANIRLAKMTNGRYELRRKKDRAKGNVQSGLELLVFDQYTGQERHVKTLSGGESFKAALSLALGLADVVQSYAGGVSLETMFIDEGFGTLDPESLDQAIETLIDIQSSGRLVGIISHVPELRERIDARLEVTATQTGSTTQFVFSNVEGVFV